MPTQDAKSIKARIRYAEQRLRDAEDELVLAKDAVDDARADIAQWKATLLQSENVDDKRTLLKG